MSRVAALAGNRCHAGLIALMGMLLCSCAVGDQRRGEPQQQPGDSPEYPHDSYSTQRHGFGATENWVFVPEQPRPVEAPVVVLVHGWAGMDPYLYGAWIKHLVLRGNIVIYPRYQANIKTKLDDMTPNALVAVQAAYQQLQSFGPVSPAPDKLAYVGHSMGGFVALNLAALSTSIGLPAPRALMIAVPGDGDGRMPRLGERLALSDMSALPHSTRILLVTADADTVVADRGAAKIWDALRGVPERDKAYVTILSDRKIRPKLIADHRSALAVDRHFDAPYRRYSSNEAVGNGGTDRSKGLLFRLRDARRQRAIERTRQRWSRRFAADAMDRDGYWRLLDEFLDVAFEPGSTGGEKDAAAKWLAGLGEGDKPGSPRLVRRSR